MSEFRENTQSVEHHQHRFPSQSAGSHILRPKVLLGLGAVLLLLYALLWGYRFVVKKSVEFQFVPPEFGHNLAGDPFFTYGKAVIVWLK